MNYKACNLALSCDEKLIASGQSFYCVALWHTDTLKLYRLMHGHGDRVTHVSFSPTKRMLASASNDKTIRLWEFPYDAAAVHVFTDSVQPISCVEFSPDGLLLVDSGWLYGRITLRSVETKEQLLVLPAHFLPVRSVQFTPDGQTIGVGSFDQTCWLWSIADGKVKICFAHANSVTCIDFSPDGKLLAAATEDGSVTLWSLVEECKQIRVLRGHFYGVVDVQFLFGGQFIATTCTIYMTRLWHTNSGDIVRTFSTNYAKINRFARDCNSLLCSLNYTAITYRPILKECHFVAVLPLLECRLPTYVVLDIIHNLLMLQNNSSFGAEKDFATAQKLGYIQIMQRKWSRRDKLVLIER